MSVYVQVSQHVNRTAFFSLLSPQAFFLLSSYYVLHPTSPPLPFLSASFSPQPLHTFHTFLTFISLCIFSFTGCLVMFSTPFAFPLVLLFQSHFFHHFLSQSQTPAEMSAPVKQCFLASQDQSQLCKQCHVPASVCFYVKGILQTILMK